MRLLSSLFIISLLIWSTLSPSLTISGSRAWLKEGVYAEYEDEKPFIMFLNRTLLYYKGRDVILTYRWKCVSIKDNLARFNITFSIKNITTKLLLHVISTELYIDIEDRDVVMANGSNVGKTALWLPSGLRKGDSVALVGKHPNVIKGLIEYETVVETVYRYQRAFRVSIKGGMLYGRPIRFTAYFDIDTGLLLHGGIDGEGTLIAINILRVFNIIDLKETNIDIGPSDLLTELLASSPLIIPPAIFFLILYLVIQRRRRRRRY